MSCQTNIVLHCTFASFAYFRIILCSWFEIELFTAVHCTTVSKHTIIHAASCRADSYAVRHFWAADSVSSILMAAWTLVLSCSFVCGLLEFGSAGFFGSLLFWFSILLPWLVLYTALHFWADFDFGWFESGLEYCQHNLVLHCNFLTVCDSFSWHVSLDLTLHYTAVYFWIVWFSFCSILYSWYELLIGRASWWATLTVAPCQSGL